MAPPKTGTSVSPIPHVAVAAEVPEAAPAARAKATPSRIVKFGLIGVAALVVLGGAFFAWKKFGTKPTPPPVATKPKAPVPAKSTVATPPAKAAPLTPSETLNNLAHAPVNAVNKAQDTIAARQAGEQSRVDGAVTGDNPKSGAVAGPSTPAAAKPGAPAPAPKTTTAVTALGPGLSATTEVEASSEASPAFRSFVANAKISGVFQGEPPRAFINGRLARAGDTIDSALGIMFEGIDPEKRELIFKDKTGATIGRRY